MVSNGRSVPLRLKGIAMAKRLEGKTCLITAAGQGIGRAGGSLLRRRCRGCGDRYLCEGLSELASAGLSTELLDVTDHDAIDVFEPSPLRCRVQLCRLWRQETCSNAKDLTGKSHLPSMLLPCWLSCAAEYDCEWWRFHHQYGICRWKHNWRPRAVCYGATRVR